MKCLRLESPGKMTLQKVSLSKPRERETVLQITHCAVCRTDAKMWTQGHRDLILPRVPGHEICGMLGTQKHVVWPGRSCGRCVQCLRGTENLCPAMRILGFHMDGGFAEAGIGPEESLVPGPAELPGHIACLAEPLACALNALDQAGEIPGKTLLIYGAGPVGLLMAMAALESGARPAVVEIDPEKVHRTSRFLRRTGIEICTNPARDDFDLAVNAAPSAEAFKDALPRLKAGGRFCFFSGLTTREGIQADLFNEIHYRQLEVVGAYGCTREQMNRAVQILARRPDDVESLIDRLISLHEVPSILPLVLSGKALRFVVSVEGSTPC